MPPRVVIGAPLYNKARWLPAALDSLLAQTYRDLAVVLIDDRSEDETVDIARRYGERDARVHVEVNERRLGMLGNTNRAFTRPLELFPDAELWMLGSDHDLWAPRFVEVLVGLLDAHPEVAMAYPLTRRIDEEGMDYERQKPPWRFETLGEPDAVGRMSRGVRRMAAGDMIYGLFRVTALRPVGAYRAVLIPDRLLLSELALRGPFAQAPLVLWRRRFRGLAELDRQRRLFWPRGAPAYARLPWWLQHTGVLAWEYGVRGKGGDVGLGRRAGAALALAYLGASLRHRAWRRWRRTRGRAIGVLVAALGPCVRAPLRVAATRALVRDRVLPALERAEHALERHAVTSEDGS